jgi:CHAT domain-containing protein
LGASIDRDVYLQARATESNLKHLKLNGYRNLLFATHGLLAGEFGPGTQPALVFSFVGDPENDGLLEMGEILGLDFNADPAVLSACNTASGSGGDDRGEGFAGLTRSFMYAGTRGLLVTQWSVESSSAKMLVEATFSKIRQGHPKAEALALAKRELITSNALLAFGPNLRVAVAHPFFWAPYILVGELR